MSNFRKEVKTLNFRRLFIALAVLSLVFTFNTCDLPMGLGDPIDWEPPVLTLDPGYPNPLYVRLGTKLAGTVTDNIGVDRVILRNANTGVEMFEAKLLSNNRWEISLDFEPEQNGEKIAVEIVAFDRVGNSGDSSITAITLIIDIRPPIIKDMKISRTAVRDAYLETYHDLFDLERTDPYGPFGTLSANVNKYQNGLFYIKGEVSEDETRIEVLGLSIYDANRDPNTPLLLKPGESRFSLPKPEGSSDYAPIWLVNEEDILNAGDKLWPDYKTNYYENGSRYYYRVAIYAIDRSGNEGESLIIEDEGFFCMWEKGDEPKGIIDRLIGSVVTKGATIPVEFFDDDTLDRAYVGLLTEDQWEGIKEIAPGTIIPQDKDNDGKLEWLRERLLAGGTVYDWKYDKKNGTQQEIVDQIAGKTFDERIIYIQTGNDESDTGIYILFTLTADKKLDPHPPYTGAVETLKPRWKGRFWLVDVIDENAPLIVFDTVNTTDSDYKPAEHSGSEINEPNLNARTGNSPEENTFPKLSEGTDGSGGRYFEINGYTLRAYREDQAVHNSVVKFRMAWIPFGIGGGHPDDYITAVQNALRGTNELSYPNTFNNLPGIQHWEFVPEPGAGQGTFIEGTDEEIGDSKFKKQVFRKRFDVLGGADDLKNVYNNFTYNGSRENETKLFVFYAEDNMGHEVFRQLRLLGNKTPPDLAVYDLTARDGITLPPGLPNLNNGDEEAGKVYFNTSGNIDEEGREEYRTDLKAYQEEGYNAMKPVALSGGNLLLTDADKTEPYQAYPRDTDIKYWVMAEKSGDLAVANIMMQDITFSTDSREVGHYNADDRSLSYVEKLPEVTQRVFLFTATDTLGNVVRIQRTVAVTNAAVLNNITTSTQSGDYGIGEIITLQANFSNLVKWTRPGGDGADNDTNRPKLNVRYQEGGVGGDTVVRSIPTKTPSDTPALFLEFDFVIQQNDTGILETMYYGMSLPAGDDNNKNNRPITIPEGTRILDYSRDDDAFTPRNSPGFDWTASGQGPRNSLQGSLDKPNKTIILDGIRPVITGFTLNPPTEKTLYADAWPGYYYKANETIQFTLTADKPIFTSGDPVVDLQIDSNWYGAAWQRASGTNGMVFSVLVNSANTPDGTITGIRLRDVSKVVDGVGNAFNAGTSTYTLFNRLNPNVTIRIDKTPPTAPGTSLNGEGVGSTTTRYYNQNPTLAISGNTGEGAVPVTTQYSLNNGVTWKEFAPDFESEPTWTSGSPGANLRILNGEWTLVTRYIDRAGNEGVATNIPATNGITTQPLHVNTAFPKLLGVSSVKPNGTYNRGNSLSFTLDFADTVTINNNTNISLTLADMTTTTNNTDGTNPSYQIILSGVNVTLATNGRTLTFTWANVNGKDMLNGLKVTALNLSGLRDRFGNYGPDAASINTATSGTVGMPASGDQAAYSVTYNLTGIIVSGILPTARTFAPVNAAGITGNNFTSAVSADNKTITITFSKPMQRGRGTITVRPHGNYAIPAVFENEGYYLTVDLDSGEEKRYAAKPAGDSTYVSGMNDVYNNMTTANRNYLITGGTLSAPEESLNTGLSAGPYKKMTHGLTQGPGYTGNYNNTTPTAPAAPGREGTTYMVPDTTTKWVLDYQYQIHATTAPVSNIRTALTSIGFRRQEIAVTSTANVAIPSGSSIVTITLSEPLLPGLQWDLFYDVGTFTDLAGNSAAAVAEGTHWFWSRGVQKPVIRVDRKSYDGRAAATVVGGQSSFIHDGSSTTQAYTDTNAYAGNIASFNTVAYRIETETPGARIFYGTQLGTGYTTGGAGSITGAWTGRATLTAGTGLNFSNSLNWNGDKANNVTVGEWVRTNLIFRNYNGNSVSNPQTGTYTVTENGIATTQVVGGPRNADGTQAGGLGNFGTNYYGFRSFNRDATATELESLPLATSGVNNMYASSFDYDNSGLQASKNYVAAQARVDHSGANNYTAITYPTASLRGYEGVFRTVIALNQAAATGGDANYILLCGTNVKSGIPTVAGFPAKDGVANTDTRFIKVFYINNTNQYYWVSTEIVTPWYMQSYRRGNTGGSYLRVGDATDWMTAGYGDLSYAYNVFSW